jgi:hypothetical protein
MCVFQDGPPQVHFAIKAVLKFRFERVDAAPAIDLRRPMAAKDARRDPLVPPERTTAHSF